MAIVFVVFYFSATALFNADAPTLAPAFGFPTTLHATPPRFANSPIIPVRHLSPGHEVTCNPPASRTCVFSRVVLLSTASSRRCRALRDAFGVA